MPTRTPDPHDDLNGGNTRPSDNRGRWIYWGGTFKEAFSESRRSDATNPPFKSVKGPRGLYNWKTSGDDTPNNKLELENTDNPIGEDSGRVSFTVNDGWQVFLYMRSENNDYFEDTVKNEWIKSDWGSWSDNSYSSVKDQLTDENWPIVWVQDNAEFSDSRTFFVLNGDDDDYLSVDIDSVSGDIGQMRVRLSGEQYFTNTEHDNEVYIVPMWIRRWDAEFEWEEDGPPPPPVQDCQTGWSWDEATETCIRDESPEPEPDPDPDPDPEEEEFPEVNLLLIGLAIVAVLVISFRVARREA